MGSPVVCDCGAIAIQDRPEQTLRCPRCGTLLVYGEEPEPPSIAPDEPDDLSEPAVRRPGRRRRSRFVATGAGETVSEKPKRHKKRRRQPPPESAFAPPRWHRWADPSTLFWSAVMALPLAVVSEMVLFALRLLNAVGDWMPGPFLLNGLLLDFPFRELGYLVLMGSLFPLAAGLAFVLQHATETIQASALGAISDSSWTSELVLMVVNLARWLVCAAVAGALFAPLFWLLSFTGSMAAPVRVAVLGGVCIAWLVYFFVGILAIALHDDIRAANPLAIAVALARLRNALTAIVLEICAHLAGYVGLYGAMMYVGRTRYGFLVWVAAWAYCILSLSRFARRLGEQYAANAKRLKWFRVRLELGE